MGKRSNFKKKSRDLYHTPLEPILPLLPHLDTKVKFVEPCAGKASLILNIEKFGHKCVRAYDIKPLKNKWHGTIKQCNVLDDDWSTGNADYIITNPPFSRNILHPMIELFSNHLPTWLLFDADWYFTLQSSALKNRLVAMVAIGRVKWFPNSTATGKDNYAWYLFDRPRPRRITKLFGREERSYYERYTRMLL